jgi:hypothetical protein
MMEPDPPLGVDACPCFSLVCDFRLMLHDGPIPDARRPTKCLKIKVNRKPTLVVNIGRGESANKSEI